MTATSPQVQASELASLIGGQPVQGSSTYHSTNPADLEDLVATLSLGDASTILRACSTAREAQRRWAAVPAPVRGQVIANAAGLIRHNKEGLAAIVTREIGKTRQEALGEVQEVIDTCEFFLSEGRRLYGMTVPSEMPDKQLFTYRTPVGVATITLAPPTTSRSASSWAGYRVRPVSATQSRKASRISSAPAWSG